MGATKEEKKMKLDYRQHLEELKFIEKEEQGLLVRMYFSEAPEELCQSIEKKGLQNVIPVVECENNKIVRYCNRVKNRLVRDKNGKVFLNQSCFQFDKLEMPQFPIEINFIRKDFNDIFDERHSNETLLKMRPNLLNETCFAGKTNWKIAYDREAHQIMDMLEKFELTENVGVDYPYSYGTDTIHDYENSMWINEVHFGGILNGFSNTHRHLASGMLCVRKIEQ